MATPSAARGPCERYVPALLFGPLVEPVVHPKPGGVTRLRSHPDKGLGDFMAHAAAVGSALMVACEASASGAGDPVEAGLEAYGDSLDELGVKTNVGLGHAVLLVPLAAALPSWRGGLERLASEASRIARGAGEGAGAAYARLLARLSPSHLGSYRGPAPDVARPGARTARFADLLRASAWDLVHSEVLGGYRLSLRAARWVEDLVRGGRGLEEAAAIALLRLISEAGDTLTALRHGMRAYLIMRAEASLALASPDPLAAAERLDAEWRRRGWSPGSAMDVLAASISLLYLKWLSN